MFDIEHAGGTYAVAFSRPPMWRGRTACFIGRVVADNETEVSGRGASVCGAGDNFNKNIGRKIAMRRALRAAGFGKPARTKFWFAYFAKRNGKKT